MEYSWILMIFFICDKVVGQPCTSYQNISQTTLQNSWANSKCFPSSPVPTWYRFTSNAAGTLSVSCPSASACGGTGNIWIKDSLPLYRDGTSSVNMCISQGSNCCQQKNDLRARNCNSFFVFELRRPPNCGIHYCFNKTDVTLVTVPTTTTIHSTTSTTTVQPTTSTTAATTTTQSTISTTTTQPTTSTKTTTTQSTTLTTTTKPTTSTRSTTSTTQYSTTTTTQSTTSATTTQPTSTTQSTTSTAIHTTSIKQSITSKIRTQSTTSAIESQSTTSKTTRSATIIKSKTQTTTTETSTFLSNSITPTTSNKSKNDQRQKEANEGNLTVAVAAGASIGALILIVIILAVVFRIYRTKLRYVLTAGHGQPFREERVKNVKFSPESLQCRNDIPLQETRLS